MRGVAYPSAALVALLRRVRGVHGNNPSAILRHIVSEPLHQLASVPPAALHGIGDPTQILHGNHSVIERVGQAGDFLRRKNG